jgi:superfamily I DNA/RNA helicase
MDEYAIASQERQECVDAVVRSPSGKKLIVAGPGTGKTYLFKAVVEGKGRTLTLTFVNSLVEDLSLELFGLSTVKTLHGFARSELERVTGRSIRVFPKLSDVVKQDAVILLGDSVDFDHLFHNRIDDDCRLGFYRTRHTYYGYYGFSDVVYAAVLYLERHQERIPGYAQVVVDEFQDFNALEVSLIDLLATRSPILLAGDDDQALYESLKSASPAHIRQRHAGEVGDFVRFALPYCSRSARVIVDSANDMITKAKEHGFLAGRIEKPFRYFPCIEKDKVSDANPYIVYSCVFAKQVSWFIQKQVEDITRDLREKYTVLILSPTRKQCQSIHDALKSKGFLNLHFTERTDSAEPCLLDGLKLLLVDPDCNLGWRLVARALLDAPEFEELLRATDGQGTVNRLVDEVTPALKKQVKRFLTTLRGIRDEKETDDGNVSELLERIGLDAYGTAARLLRGELPTSKQRLVDAGIRRTQIQITTFQSSKGLAADYVFITHFDDRYCIRDKTSGMSDQDICSFLVALTRARRRVYLLSTDSTRIPTFLSWIDPGRVCKIEAAGSDPV